MHFNENNLLSQFILCKSQKYIPKNWIMRREGLWWLACHPMLPVIEMRTSDSSCLGWLIGYPIDTTGWLLKDIVTLPDSALEYTDLHWFESWLYSLGGRFASVLLTPEITRFYLDCCGSLAAVYSPKYEIVASSTILIPYSKGTEENKVLIETLGIPRSDHWYPFGLTPIFSVERLLPNHFLDVSKWKSVRHWPDGEITMHLNTGGIVSEISSIIRRNISAVIRDYPIYLTLTAGRESRMLLACAREQLERITFLTMLVPDSQGKLDCLIARKIARRYGLDHVILKDKPATKVEQEMWLKLIGHCVGGRIAKCFATLHQSDPKRPILTGLGGEVGRAHYWKKQDTPFTQLSAIDLLERLHLPKIPDFEDRAERWLEGLSSNYDTMMILDLLYIEQRLACWGTAQQYGNYWNIFELLPFAHRRIFELMLSLPYDYRRKQMISSDIVRSQWPELLKVPFNRDEGIKGYIQFFNRKIRNMNRRLTRTLRRALS
jgi:hypothetical protein